MTSILFAGRLEPLSKGSGFREQGQCMFAGLNVLLLARYLAFSHLRHSPVPLRFPRRMPDVRVSPQMLQAHHSVEARHHDRNFGAALAIWDWMFGTLVMPRQGERFEFGV